MHKTLKNATGGLALAIGLGGGCVGGATPIVTPSDPAQVTASINQSLDRLRALQIFDVGNLVLNLPAEATACYNLPCPGSGWEQPYQDERARQAARLQRLADIAEATARNPPSVVPPCYQTFANVGAVAIKRLADLQIVEVSAFVPVNCYSQACPTDLQISEAATIADQASRSGL